MPFTKVGTDITLAGFLENIALFSLVGALNTGVGRATDPTIQKRSRYSQENWSLNGRGNRKNGKIAITLAFWSRRRKNAYELGEAIIKGAIQKQEKKSNPAEK